MCVGVVFLRRRFNFTALNLIHEWNHFIYRFLTDIKRFFDVVKFGRFSSFYLFTHQTNRQCHCHNPHHRYRQLKVNIGESIVVMKLANVYMVDSNISVQRVQRQLV